MSWGKCQRQGCGRDATHYPGLLIPARGYPPTPRSNCIESGLGLRLCEEHAGDRTFAATVPVMVQSNLNDMLKSINKQPVDWKRTTIEARPLGDDLWCSLQRQSGLPEGPVPKRDDLGL